MRREEQQHSDLEEGWKRRRAGGAVDWSRDPPLQPRGYSLQELRLCRVQWEQLSLETCSLRKGPCQGRDTLSQG